MNIVFIADIHFGAIDSAKLFKNLNDEFLKKVHDYCNESKRVINLLVIGGDLFDRKLSLNSSDSKYLMYFLNELYTSSFIEKVVILKGTQSHDYNQLDNFTHMYSDKFNIINTITEDRVEDMKILYVPEEIIEEDMEEYYKSFHNKEYDYIFGHGTFQHIAFASKNTIEYTAYKKVPVFPSDFWKAKHGVYFGHIHKHDEYKGKYNVNYVGSFSRWKHGEEDDKGFYIINSDNNIENDFIVNEKAPLYITENIDKIIDSNRTIDEKVEKIIKVKNNNNIYRLRLFAENFTKEEDFNILKEYFMNHDLGITLFKKEDDKQELLEEQVSEEIKKLNYIFDENNSLENIVSEYIKSKFDIDISPKTVKSYLNESEV